MADDDHTFDRDWLNQHKGVKQSAEGGRCLNRHVSSFSEYSCAHRWQAYERALEDSHYYNGPRYEGATQAIATDRYMSKSGKPHP